jgi:hypothetical protein
LTSSSVLCLKKTWHINKQVRIRSSLNIINKNLKFACYHYG